MISCAWEHLGAGADAADDVLASFGVEIAKALDPLKPKDYERIVRKLATELKGHVVPVEGAALKKAVSKLDVDWATMSAAQRQKTIDAANGYLGAPVAHAVLPKIQTTLSASAKDLIPATKSKSVLTYGLNIAPSLSETDERIAKFTVASQGHFIRDELGKRSEAFGTKARAVVASGLERGLGSEDIAERLNDVLGVDAGRGLDYWNVIAMVFANRARTMTQLASFHEAGIGAFTWDSVLDEATSVQCRFLHGRKFYVKDAMKSFDSVEKLDDPEEIKSVQPFMQFGTVDGKPSLYLGTGDNRKLVAHVDENAVGRRDARGKFSKEMEDDALRAAGVHAPPIHGRCRSTIEPDIDDGGGGGAQAQAQVPAQIGAPPSKLTPAQVKAQALDHLDQLTSPGGTVAPNEVLKPAPDGEEFHDITGLTSHPAFDSLSEPGVWAANATSKKPKLAELQATIVDVDSPDVAALIKNPKKLDAAPVPKVVKYDGQLWVIDGHEQLVAQKLLGQKVAYCQIVDLDKKLKPAGAPALAPAPPVPSAPAQAPSPVAPPPHAPPPPAPKSAKELAHEKLAALAPSGTLQTEKLFPVVTSPPYSGKVGQVDALFASAAQPKTVDLASVVATNPSMSATKIKALVDDDAALKAALKNVKVAQVDGKLYCFGGHDALVASKLLGKDGIEAKWVDASKVVAPPAPPPPMPAPPPIPAPPRRSGSALAHLPAKELPNRAPAQRGYDEKARERIAHAGVDERESIRAFTGSAYTSIRRYEMGSELGNVTAKERSQAIARAFKQTPPMPGTVYRGVHSISEGTIAKMLAEDTIEMGATSSTSRSPGVANKFAGAASSHYSAGDYKVVLVLKAKSTIAIETISSYPEEKELLLPKEAKFKVTGRHRAAHNDHVLIIEAEETTDALYEGK